LAALERVFQKWEAATKGRSQRDPAPSNRQRDPAPSNRQRDPAPSDQPGRFNEREYYESLPRRPMFVYGTLRTGQGNWRNFLQGRTSQETPAVARDRALYDNGLAYAHERPGHQVVGDLVEVSEADYAEVMRSVDGLEGYDPRRDNGHYVRRTCTVQTDDGREVEAWIYHGSESATRRFTDDDLVPDGDWLAGRSQALRRRAQAVQNRIAPPPRRSSPPPPPPARRAAPDDDEPAMYFAFGSNMDESRMQTRGVTYSDRQAATLPGYRLTFDKASGRTGGGYATVQPDPDDHVEGALYTTTKAGIRRLDGYEGYPTHYDRQTVTVQTADGNAVEAIAYVAQPSQITPGSRPTKDYLRHLLAGKDILSPEYAQKLEQTETAPDPPSRPSSRWWDEPDPPSRRSSRWWDEPDQSRPRAPAPTSKPVHYFAFGSNMDESKMRSRGVRYTDRQSATLPGYRLTFDKQSFAHEGVGYATAKPDPEETIEGALYTMDQAGVRQLDRYEGYPTHYDRQTVTVLTSDGKPVEAIAYLAQAPKIQPGLRPTKSYLGHLLAGKDVLSPEYARRLEQTETVPDPPPRSTNPAWEQAQQRQSRSAPASDPREARRQEIEWEREALAAMEQEREQREQREHQAAESRPLTREEHQAEMEREWTWEQLALRAMEEDDQQRESEITATWERLQRAATNERNEE
jgi:gamma-glutamylcyclotransferase (GGCT)/AIG2-like uncharacterized protein YtfP